MIRYAMHMPFELLRIKAMFLFQGTGRRVMIPTAFVMNR